MATLISLVEEMLKEYESLQSKKLLRFDKEEECFLLNASSKSATFNSTLKQVADRLQQDDRTWKNNFSDEERVKLVAGAFERALKGAQPNGVNKPQPDDILRAVREDIRAQARIEPYEYCVGCILFWEEVQEFSIGPVRFEPKQRWLERKVSEGAFNKSVADLIKKRWPSEEKFDSHSQDHVRANNIINFTSGYDLVCSISTEGMAFEAGREKALTSARLAMAAIASLWSNPSEQLGRLSLSSHSSTSRLKMYVSSSNGSTVHNTWSDIPVGIPCSSQEWGGVREKFCKYFDVIGEILMYGLYGTGKVARPNIMQALYHGLLWFHEACQERMPVIAVVKFAACMDSLAGGNGADSILKLLRARAQYEGEKIVGPCGETLEQVIKKIYGPGRSRTIHGNNNDLGHDWTPVRMQAEYFARLCLSRCVQWVVCNPSSKDDPKLFLECEDNSN